MPGDRDEELAETAAATPGAMAAADHTATEADAVAPTRDSGLRDQLGRYQIGRELGRGGMGVVHSAFDPDLERKIALKVLPAEVENADARQRLLREARAMARLSHPNVVTVHEVGTVHGRDFIAMELIDGKTLEDWLEASPRTEREILAAFVAAGRGLAAAHAAGLVHRDFKPRNVLRNKDGRIVVTDFGLVVGVEGEGTDAFKVTMPSGPVNAKTTPSSLSGLTKTGSVLGTPAYMAPEQWTGGQVGPAADQFAFCVALWEALAKERPYMGSTLEDLKVVVLAGKRTAESKIPRKLRKVLRRGLEPDPARRYPNMNALLDAITRSERRPTVMFALAGAAVVAAVVVYAVAIRSQKIERPKVYVQTKWTCAASVLPSDHVWTAQDADKLRAAHQELAAQALESDFEEWQRARERTCALLAAEIREPRLACLDGVLSRIDAVKETLLKAKLAERREIQDLLVEPKVCEVAQPPRLARIVSPEARDVMRLYLEHQGPNAEFKEADVDQMIADTGTDPCASAAVHQIGATVRTDTGRSDELAKADRDAQRCGDDRIVADIALTAVSLASAYAELDFRTALVKAEVLAARVMETSLEAQLEQNRATLAFRVDDADAIIEHYGKAAQLYDQRGMVRSAASLQLELIRWKLRRGKPEDLAGANTALDQLRARIVEKLGTEDEYVNSVDLQRASWLWIRGDLEGAEKLRQHATHMVPAKSPVTVSGEVVDDKGPVAGAQVSVGTVLYGDSLHAATSYGGDQRTVTTGPDGRFEIVDAEAKSYLIAKHDDLRSAPVAAGDHMTVKLLPTSKVTGTVDLHGRSPTQVMLMVVPAPVRKGDPTESQYGLLAPVAADGTFSIAGVQRGAMIFRTSVTIVTTQMIDAVEVAVNKPVLDDIHLQVKSSSRPIEVLVRSTFGTPLVMANLFLIAGKQPAEPKLSKLIATQQNTTVKLALPPEPQQEKPSIKVRKKAGDLYASFPVRPDGDVSLCAWPMPDQLDDPSLEAARKDSKLLDKVPVKCIPVKATDDLVEIAISPWPRFD